MSNFYDFFGSPKVYDWERTSKEGIHIISFKRNFILKLKKKDRKVIKKNDEWIQNSFIRWDIF